MDYTVIKSDRKTVALQINSDGELIVRIPKRFPKYKVDKIVDSHRDWINKKTQEALIRKENHKPLSEDVINDMKNKARAVIPPLVERYAEIMNVNYGTVKITSAQKRFGSCSAKNNLCFSYILMQYPLEAIEYVVVHELAHTVHHDHSKAFYELIERYLPDYKEREAMLKK